jgi:lipopolysaccharide/colanic/teichoic acid biosynthesis glycosyltransferase
MKITTEQEKQNLLLKLWVRWKRFGRRLGDFQARLILTVLYFVVVAPFALIVRFASDPLSIKPHQRGWRARAEAKGSPMNRALNQF